MDICYFRFIYVNQNCTPSVTKSDNHKGVELGWGLHGKGVAGPLPSHVHWYCRDKAAVAVNIITVAVSRGAWRSVVG